MTQDEIVKLLGGGGAFAALLYLLYLVGMRIVAALDRVATKVDAHQKDDLASHADMRTDIAALHGKIDGLLDGQDRYTPVGVEIPEPPSRRTPAGGVQIGVYSHVRPGTKGR